MIASIINISEINFDSPLKYASSVLSIVILVVISIATAIEIYVIRVHLGRYHLEDFISKYGAIIKGLDTNKRVGRYWNPLILIRWALTIVVLVFLHQHSVAQIFILLVISVIFQMMMAISNPWTEKWDKLIGWMIEVSISIYLYILLSLTDFMGGKTVREELGWVLTILTATIVAINVVFFFWKSFWRVVAYIKQRFGHLFLEKARKGQYEDSEK